jgi:hypothetical protein
MAEAILPNDLAVQRPFQRGIGQQTQENVSQRAKQALSRFRQANALPFSAMRPS